jgi:hypothetical protein
LGALGLSAVVALSDSGLRHAVRSAVKSIETELVQEAGTPVG